MFANVILDTNISISSSRNRMAVIAISTSWMTSASSSVFESIDVCSGTSDHFPLVCSAELALAGPNSSRSWRGASYDVNALRRPSDQ